MTEKKRRVIIPDTNVFLHDAEAIYAFPGDLLKIPLEVIEEIDDQKRRMDDVGRNARQTSRILDELRVKGSLTEGVVLENGCILSIAFGDKSLSALPHSLRTNKEDNRILATALSIASKSNGDACCFVTKDINMRIKAEAIGLITMDYEAGKIEYEELYQGFREREISSSELERFKTEGRIELQMDPPLSANELVTMICEDKEDCAYGRMDPEAKVILPLKYTLDNVFAGIQPLNPEQLFAFDLLMDPRVQLVTLNGRAGTGKTLLALAAGVKLVLEDSVYSELLVSRPVIPMGKDLGYLPGGVHEKMDPWMEPIYDNLDHIFSSTDEKKKQKRNIRDIMDSTNQIQVEPLSYIRGRSMPDRFMIIDEAQNLSPHEVKTIVTRAGKNTKIVLTGDPYQIDHPYLDINSNGLNYAVERMREEAIAGHMTLVKGERSELAELAAELL